MLNITAHPGKAHETEDDEEDNDEKEEKELAHGSAGPSTKGSRKVGFVYERLSAEESQRHNMKPRLYQRLRDVMPRSGAAPNRTYLYRYLNKLGPFSGI